MKLIDRLFKKQPRESLWDSAYPAEPHFYSKPDGTALGAFAFTENTPTIFPLDPQFAVDGKPVLEWRMTLVSTSVSGASGDADYFEAMRLLLPSILETRDNCVLLRGQTADELCALLVQCGG